MANMTIALTSFVVWLPLLRWLFGFWFDDWETFIAETGYRNDDDVWWKLTRLETQAYYAVGKLLIGVIAPYLIVAVMTAYSIIAWLGLP
jgi:hypothetical protein